MMLRLLPYSPERDVYRLLDVPSSASIEEITAACRRLSRTFHPDLNGSGRATEEMQVVNVVRQVMSDPEWRATYDRERYRFHAAMSQPSEPMLRSWPPMSVRAERPRGPFQRYLRATAAAIRVTVAGLARPRCRSCRMVIPSTDAYCVACGTPLLPGGRVGTG